MGSAAGSIRDLFSKIKAIDAKHGKFDLVLCTGDFFGPLKDTTDAAKDDDDISLLLNGSLEGMLLPYQSSGYIFILLYSSLGMLRDARGSTSTSKSC